MLLRNLQGEQLNAVEFKNSLKNLENTELLTQEELEIELGDYYDTALVKDAADNNYVVGYANEVVNVRSFLRQTGGGIFQRIRKFICDFLKATSTVDDIIDAVIKAIASIIPGGIFIQAIVKKLVKFILNKGYTSLCPVPQESN